MANPSDNTIVDQLRVLVEKRTRGHAPDTLDLPTALPWLWLLRRPAPTPARRGILSPSVCLLVQGEKEMPVSGQVTRASEASPYYGISIDLDPREVTALVLEMGLRLSSGQADPPAVSVERADDALLDV
jgi:hypothetical protein